MWQTSRIRLGILYTVGLAMIGPLFAQQERPVWGKRIWAKDISAGRKIVVDERGSPDQGKVLYPYYVWRLLKDGEQVGPFLFSRQSNFHVGTAPEFEPLEVLYSGMINDDLFTVFNQRGRCWACLVHRHPNGYMEERPSLFPEKSMATQAGLAPSIVGPAMRTADMTTGPDGAILLSVTDDQRRSSRFQLRSEEHKPPGGVVYYWYLMDSAATKPGLGGARD